jgi:3-deoxy-7-phosphoheptulonate synthase
MQGIMNGRFKKLPSPEELAKRVPLSERGRAQVAKDRTEVKNILEGSDKRLLVIVGPCSAWPREAVWEYAEKLKALESKVHDQIKIVMRAYTQKPRTTKGWTGTLSQPDPHAPSDAEAGMLYSREMMVRIVELGLPIADEALYTHASFGFLDLLSWVAIGARSSEDQEHRMFASGLESAVGMKNPTSGSLEIAVNSLVSAQHPHVGVFHDNEVETLGNPHAHLVLRGGEKGPNYSGVHIKEAQAYMHKHGIKNPAIIIDASHDNTKIDGVKSHTRQADVVREVMRSLHTEPELRAVVKGFMIESFIKGGNQKVNPEHPEHTDRQGLSITDPCLSWEETERLLLEVYENQKK